MTPGMKFQFKSLKFHALWMMQHSIEDSLCYGIDIYARSLEIVDNLSILAVARLAHLVFVMLCELCTTHPIVFRLLVMTFFNS